MAGKKRLTQLKQPLVRIMGISLTHCLSGGNRKAVKMSKSMQP
jgi:hypothetical protein